MFFLARIQVGAVFLFVDVGEQAVHSLAYFVGVVLIDCVAAILVLDPL